jgi:ankyrin repeat protein
MRHLRAWRLRATAALPGGVCILFAAATAASIGLPEAAHHQQKAAIEELLKQHADVNATDVEGMTALIWAAHWNDLALVRTLLSAGAKPSVKSAFDDSALYEACGNRNAAMVEALLKAGADANASRGEGETALMTASRTGSAETVKVLLAHGADPQAQESWRHESALMWAAAENHADVVRALIAAGADVNAKSIVWDWPKLKLRSGDLGVALPDGGLSTLMYAARQGALEPARLLVEAGTDINYKEPQGYSALLIAILNGQYELASMLIDNGAKIDDGALRLTVEVRDMDKSDKHPAPTDYGKLHSLDFMKILLDHGAAIDGEFKPRLPQRAIMEGGGPAIGSPLYRAARSTDLEAMRLLLERGANPKYTTQNHSTVLMAAAGQNFNKETGTGGEQKDAIEATKMLMARGVDVNTANDLGQTALHFAAQKGSEKVIEFLAESGAKLDARDKRGKTPLDIASGIGLGGNSEGVPEEEAMAVLKKLLAAKGRGGQPE